MAAGEMMAAAAAHGAAEGWRGAGDDSAGVARQTAGSEAVVAHGRGARRSGEGFVLAQRLVVAAWVAACWGDGMKLVVAASVWARSVAVALAAAARAAARAEARTRTSWMERPWQTSPWR